MYSNQGDDKLRNSYVLGIEERNELVFQGGGTSKEAFFVVCLQQGRHVTRLKGRDQWKIRLGMV